MPGPWKLDINIQYNPDGDCSMSFLFQILDPKTEGIFLGLTTWKLHAKQFRTLSRYVTCKTTPINEGKRDV